jgi:type IX secretion system PorP/SprF family membrane protein
MKKQFAFLLPLLLAFSTNAQQVPLYTLYGYQPVLLNPAFTGYSDHVNTFLLHRNQWRNYPGAPESTFLGIDAPFRSKKIGLGASFYDHRAGFMEKQGMNVAYAYSVDLSDVSALRFGLALGITNNRIDFAEAMVKDPDDPYLLNGDVRRTVLDANAGLLFTLKNLQLGASVPQLLGNPITYFGSSTSTVYRVSRSFIFSAGQRFNLQQDGEYTLSPQVVLHAGAAPPTVDIHAVLGIKNTASVGIFYRSTYAMGMNFKVDVHHKLGIGYGYAALLGEPGTYRGSSHELMLSYSFSTGADKKQLEKQLEKYQQDLILLAQRIDGVADSVKASNKDEVEKLKNVITDLSTQIEKLKKDSADTSAAFKLQIALLEEKVNTLLKLIGN